jgi:hypothetical protein
MTARQLLMEPIVVQILPRLLRTIPELRQTVLWRGYFVTEPRLYFHLAWLGAALALWTRSPFALAGAVPWIMWLYSIRGGLTIRGTISAARLIGLIHYLFSATTLVLFFASARYRRLVL